MKKPQNSKNHGFPYYYYLMLEGSVQIMMDPDTDPGGQKTYRWIQIRSNSTVCTCRITIGF
jgi:hypothetical protein